MSNAKSSILKLSTTTDGKIALVRKIVDICIEFWKKPIADKKDQVFALSDTEKNVLSYFIVYGIDNNCKALITKAGICKNVANINTIMVKLKKLNLIYKDDLNSKNYVCKQLSFEVTPMVGIFLKIQNK